MDEPAHSLGLSTHSPQRWHLNTSLCSARSTVHLLVWPYVVPHPAEVKTRHSIMVECTWWRDLGWVGEAERGRWGANRGFVYIPPSPFVFMPMLSRVNGKDQRQIIIGGVDSGSGGRGPETGFVSIWEFVAVHAFIMKLNEARKCSVGRNAAPLMFSWQFWRESIQDRNVANCNSVRCSCSFTICKQFWGCAVRFTRGYVR